MNAPARCPACSAQSSRKSRWHSHEERVAHPGQHPFRCSACGHRFLAPYAGTVERRRWPLWVGLGAVLMIAGIVAGTVLVALDEDAAPTPQAASAIAPTLEAARAGDAEAQFRLGRSLLLEADSNRTKSEEAGVWLKRAAEAGHTGAMVLLGKRYRSGIGTPQNYEIAARWLGEAARAGDPEGMVEFGRLHRSGIGVEQDDVQAYVWFNRAAAALNMDGVQERDSIAIKLSAEALKRAQALLTNEAEGAEDAPETPSSAPSSTSISTPAADSRARD